MRSRVPSRHLNPLDVHPPNHLLCHRLSLQATRAANLHRCHPHSPVWFHRHNLPVSLLPIRPANQAGFPRSSRRMCHLLTPVVSRLLNLPRFLRPSPSAFRQTSHLVPLPPNPVGYLPHSRRVLQLRNQAQYLLHSQAFVRVLVPLRALLRSQAVAPVRNLVPSHRFSLLVFHLLSHQHSLSWLPQANLLASHPLIPLVCLLCSQVQAHPHNLVCRRQISRRPDHRQCPRCSRPVTQRRTPLRSLPQILPKGPHRNLVAVHQFNQVACRPHNPAPCLPQDLLRNHLCNLPHCQRCNQVRFRQRNLRRSRVHNQVNSRWLFRPASLQGFHLANPVRHHPLNLPLILRTNQVVYRRCNQLDYLRRSPVELHQCSLVGVPPVSLPPLLLDNHQ